MSRLQKKCFIGATGLHVLLLVILFVGPAFISADKVDDAPVLTFIPSITTDEKVSGGGSPLPAAPRVQPPPPTPAPKVEPQPEPPAQPERQPDPEPRKVETPKIAKPDPDSLETKPEPKPHKVQVSDNVVKLKPTKPTNPKPNAQTAANNERKQQVAKALSNISGSLSPAVKLEAPAGPGGGGPSYANYDQTVRKIYYEAWTIPPDVNEDEATVKVRVTVARNGNVISSSIVQSSGSLLVDRSIQATLDRVTFIAPFPAGAKEPQRTFTMTFSLKAKKLLG